MIISIISSVLNSGFLIFETSASQTSVKLWGGMFVAIPTAIPEAPLRIKVGSFPGKSSGSSVELS